MTLTVPTVAPAFTVETQEAETEVMAVEEAEMQESIEKAEEILSEDGAEVIKDEETIIF